MNHAPYVLPQGHCGSRIEDMLSRLISRLAEKPQASYSLKARWAVLLASVSLIEENWRPLLQGNLIAVLKGELVAELQT